MQKIFSENSIKKLFLDSFPAGIIGEFADFDFGETEIFYIARLLKWKNYSHFLNGKTPHFKKTFILEKLEKDHQKFIENYSEKVINFELIYPQFETQDKKLLQKIVKNTPFLADRSRRKL